MNFKSLPGILSGPGDLDGSGTRAHTWQVRIATVRKNC